MANTPIVSLPDEILHCILCFSSPTAAVALEQTAKRFENIANAPLLWRFYCLQSFKFWDKRHRISRKFASPASETDWKRLYKARHLIDVSTTRILNSMLASQTGRIEKLHDIVSFGYDVKDTLLRHAEAGEDEDDHLARA